MQPLYWILISVMPELLLYPELRYYWIAALLVAILVGVMSTFCVASEGRKSLVVVLASSALGGWGMASAIGAIVSLYVAGTRL